jgi:hypothetical protein
MVAEVGSVSQSGFGEVIVRKNRFGQPDGRTVAGESTRSVRSAAEISRILEADPQTLSRGELLTRLCMEKGVDLGVLAQMTGFNFQTLSRVARGIDQRHTLLKEGAVEIIRVLGVGEDNPVARLLIEKSPVVHRSSIHGRILVGR